MVIRKKERDKALSSILISLLLAICMTAVATLPVDAVTTQDKRPTGVKWFNSYKSLGKYMDKAIRDHKKKIVFYSEKDNLFEESPSSDPRSTATTLIKMTTPSFSNVVMAFRDPDSRIRLNSEIETGYQSCLLNLKVYGGYLDGLDIDFSDNLVTIIGGRGTGKSTIINFIRYALDLPPREKQRKYNLTSCNSCTCACSCRNVPEGMDEIDW